MPQNIADYLVGSKIKMVGVEQGGIDHHPYPIHRTFLQNDILIIEDLQNLTTLLEKEFTVFALPLKLQLDGSPARVIAEIK